MVPRVLVSIPLTVLLAVASCASPQTPTPPPGAAWTPPVSSGGAAAAQPPAPQVPAVTVAASPGRSVPAGTAMSTAATSGKGPASAPAAGTPTSPSPRATGSSAAGATAPRPASTSQRIAIPGADLEFDLPADWQRQGEAWAWQTAGSETARLGVAWRDTQPGTEIEAMLPAQSVVKNRTPGPAELSWGTAATYLVQVMRPASQGQTQAWEQHVLVRHGGRSYDLYASGKDEAELAAMEPAFRMMLASSRAK